MKTTSASKNVSKKKVKEPVQLSDNEQAESSKKTKLDDNNKENMLLQLEIEERRISLEERKMSLNECAIKAKKDEAEAKKLEAEAKSLELENIRKRRFMEDV